MKLPQMKCIEMSINTTSTTNTSTQFKYASWKANVMIVSHFVKENKSLVDWKSLFQKLYYNVTFIIKFNYYIPLKKLGTAIESVVSSLFLAGLEWSISSLKFSSASADNTVLLPGDMTKCKTCAVCPVNLATWNLPTSCYLKSSHSPIFGIKL